MAENNYGFSDERMQEVIRSFWANLQKSENGVHIASIKLGNGKTETKEIHAVDSNFLYVTDPGKSYMQLYCLNALEWIGR